MMCIPAYCQLYFGMVVCIPSHGVWQTCLGLGRPRVQRLLEAFVVSKAGINDACIMMGSPNDTLQLPLVVTQQYKTLHTNWTREI